MRGQPAHDHTPLCGESCRYRGLYEGTQASLSDMAAKQAAALGRIGRLRSGVIAVMRAANPRAFAAIEQSNSRRVADADDAFVIACVEHLMRNGTSETSSVPFGELRGHLERLGVTLLGEDPTAWVQQLRGMTTPVEPVNSNAPKATPTSFTDAARQRSVMKNSWEGALAPLAGAPGGQELTLPTPLKMPETVETVSPTVKAPTEVEQKTQPAQVTDGLSDIFDAPSSSADDVDDIYNSSSDDDIFNVADDSFASEGAEDFGGGAPTDDDNDDPFADLFEPEPANPLDTAVASDEGVASFDAEETAPAETVASAGWQVAELTSVGPAKKIVSSAPVRVELFPHQTPQRPAGTKRRKPRTSALPPEAFELPEGLIPDSLTPQRRQQLNAAATIPRPVFTGDLVQMTGDVRVVEQWEEDHRNNRGSVAFIQPKARHRQIGALVLPVGDLRKASNEFSSSWWAASVERYRGAKLYELGVVGRRCADGVKGWHVDDVYPVVSLRASLGKGLVGVLIVCDDELSEGSTARTGIVSEIESLMREPLEHIYVLATGDSTLDSLQSVVEEEAKRRQWKPACPVVCARSWEWADGTGPLIVAL